MNDELTKTSLKKFADAFASSTDGIFELDQRLNPIWFLERESGSLSVIESSWVADGTKEAAVGFVKKHIRDHKVVRLCHIFEGWLLEAENEEDIPESIKLGARIASHPRRKEAVCILAEDRAGNSLYMRRLILRPEGQKATLSPIEVMSIEEPGQGERTGLLTNFFKD